MNRFDPHAVIAADLTAVNACLRANLGSDVLLIQQVAEYIVGSGGKRLRPVLLLLVASALGRNDSRTHAMAAVVEMIHTATLLHDDVVDESQLRRGRKTANALFGNAASVLVGDFLYSRAFQMMVGVGDMGIMRALADATNSIAEGEVLQLMNIGNADVSQESYLQVIRFKTAKLFEAAARIGALAVGAPVSTSEAMAEYGMRLGTAFQLIDDVLDYSGEVEQIGKNLGDDLCEGKATMPLLRVLAAGDSREQALVRSAISDPATADFNKVLGAILRVGAIDFTRAAARAEAERAAAQLAVLPAGPSRQTLLELCAFAVERNA